MRFINALLAGALLVAGGAAQAAPEQADKAAAELARALKGRVTGKPVDCLQLRDIRSTRIIDNFAILYEMNGGKLYLNRPRSGADLLDKWDVLVTDTHSPQLCSIDIVRLYDQATRMPSGFVGLGKFVPYTKPKAQD